MPKKRTGKTRQETVPRTETTREEKTNSSNGWVAGLVSFAAAMMIVVGMFQFFEGLAAILRKNYFVIGKNYIYQLDVTTWGWIHLIIGIIVVLAGIYIFWGRTWARAIGVILAMLSAIANFFYIPYYPLWAILIIALDVTIIWALATYNPELA